MKLPHPQKAIVRNQPHLCPKDADSSFQCPQGAGAGALNSPQSPCYAVCQSVLSQGPNQCGSWLPPRCGLCHIHFAGLVAFPCQSYFEKEVKTQPLGTARCSSHFQLSSLGFFVSSSLVYDVPFIVRTEIFHYISCESGLSVPFFLVPPFGNTYHNLFPSCIQAGLESSCLFAL